MRDITHTLKHVSFVIQYGARELQNLLQLQYEQLHECRETKKWATKKMGNESVRILFETQREKKGQKKY
jgi:hypothetical protein